MDPFLLRAGLAALGLTAVAGPLGAFVVWRRMAYLGDATAHAALLGVALALMLDIWPVVGVAVIGIAVALAASTAFNRKGAGPDALLGTFAHGALALGLIALAATPGAQVNLDAYLFGNVMEVSWRDVALIWVGGAAILAVLARFWQGLVLATASPELAQAEGVNVRALDAVLMVLIALAVAGALKVVGALMATALLIIPAAAARALARTPLGMVFMAVGIGATAALIGLGVSMRFSAPAGPAIVASAFGLFLLTRIAARVIGRR